MHSVDLSQSKGVGEWFRELRGNRSRRDVAASAGISERTLQRYEKDQGPSYEMLRLLDALGVRMIPPPPNGAPRAIGAELQEIHGLLAQMRGESAAGRHSFSRSLEALDDSLAGVRRALELLVAQSHGQDEHGPTARGEDG